MFRIIWLFLIGCLLIVFPAAASTNQTLSTDLELVVESADTPLVIHEILRDGVDSASGNVQLTVKGGDIEQLRLLASDLTHARDPNKNIARTHVSIANGIGLKVDRPVDVKVSISGLEHPGLYTGEITFVADEQAGELLTIPVELRLTAEPKVMPLNTTLSIQVVNCVNRLDCWLAPLFLPPTVISDSWDVLLNNQTVEPVEVIGGEVVLRGKVANSVPGAADITVEVPQLLGANEVDSLSLKLNRANLKADQYEGALRLNVSGRDDPIAINMNLDVRLGPLWAMMITLIGILLGRLAKGLESTATKTQFNLLPIFYDLRNRANKLENDEARQDVLDQLSAFKADLDNGSQGEEDLKAILDSIESKIKTYEALHRLETADLSDALKADVDYYFKEARRALARGEIKTANRHIQNIRSKLEAAGQEVFMGKGGETIVAKTELDHLENTAKKIERPVRSRFVSMVWSLMSWLSGNRVNTEIKYWIFRPIATIVLLILLVILGMQSFYVNAGAGFGANLVYDYLALLLWGLSSDVISRTLTNFGN